ncbi:MAG TPA: hypothetical protein VFX65_01895 [Candidatus Limnocylindrales bacterium]|nr:hypothetical protein [Candidatus Limnocylindrales bacterium]
MRFRLSALVALGLVLGLAIPSVVGAKPASSADLQRARVIAYWTPARIASAVPRDFVRDAAGKLVPNAKPPGTPGGGGGGSGDGSVKGASWTGDGFIEARSGRVLFAMGGGNWICSASVVNDGSTSNGYSTIVTAGHCVYDGSDGWATNWIFIPDFDDAPVYSPCSSTALGCWTATRLGANADFVAGGGFGNDTVDVDYGFARVGLGGKTGPTQELDALVGSYGLKTSSTSLSDQQWAFGYPAEGKYKGRDLIYCTNVGASLIADPYGSNTWGMACNMNGGSSGGPWVHGPSNPGTDPGKLVASVNSYGYSSLTYMFGPKFNSETTTVHADVIDGSATTGVSSVRNLP